MSYHHRYPGSDMRTFYSYGRPGDVTALLREDVEGLGGQLGEVRLRRSWASMPYFGGDDLRDGVLDRLEALQGRDRTYWVGGLPAFELVECAVAHAQDLARRHFPPARSTLTRRAGSGHHRGGTADMSEPLRIGVLGAARISASSLIGPARATGHRVVAVAARDRSRAEAYAAEHGVERVAGSSPNWSRIPVEVVYNPLANGLHGPWNLAALAAGKHVLSEKPSASNAEEAAEVREAAGKAGTVFMEAFHYLFHPVTRRLHEILASGEIGELRHVEALVAIPAPPDTDPRWSLPLAGGAVMDLGCYSLHALRMLAPWAGGTPDWSRRGAGAGGRPRRGRVAGRRPGLPGRRDRFRPLPHGVRPTGDELHITGSRGEAYAPNSYCRTRTTASWSAPSGERTERLGTRSSYTYQLEAFASRVCGGTALPLDADDAAETMTLIDSAYRAAGFEPRPRVS
ncbi:Inositol 2-dehydrogenase/D-chiro-inositol 3-dehydrogenase [Streptomyces tendae]